MFKVLLAPDKSYNTSETWTKFETEVSADSLQIRISNPSSLRSRSGQSHGTTYHIYL